MRSPTVVVRANYKRIGWLEGHVDQALVASFQAIPEIEDASLFTTTVTHQLKGFGYLCASNVKVPNRGDGRRGIVAIVAIKEPEKLYIEVSRCRPRKKDIFKVQQPDATGAVVLCRTRRRPQLDQSFADTWITRQRVLTDQDYQSYLKSDEWRRIKQVASKREHYQKCWLCGATENLELHHRSYKWLGTPHAMRGLVAMCRTCHGGTHDYAKRNGLSVRRATNRLKKEKRRFSPMNNKLTDISLMPFGQHKGKLMQDVPAGYLHWLWVNGKKEDHSCPVAQYIKENLHALRQEYRDGIWA